MPFHLLHVDRDINDQQPDHLHNLQEETTNTGNAHLSCARGQGPQDIWNDFVCHSILCVNVAMVFTRTLTAAFWVVACCTESRDT